MNITVVMGATATATTTAADEDQEEWGDEDNFQSAAPSPTLVEAEANPFDDPMGALGLTSTYESGNEVDMGMGMDAESRLGLGSSAEDDAAVATLLAAMPKLGHYLLASEVC